MISAKKSITEKRRSKAIKKNKGAGGSWGDRFRARLALVLAERYDGNQAWFAKACKLYPTRVSGWLSGKALPGLESINAIALQTGVSVDWLMTGVGHDGQPADAVVYQRQYRTKPELLADLREAIGREVGDTDGLPFDYFDVDINKLLNETVDNVRAELALYNEWYGTEFQQASVALHLAQSALSQLPIAKATDHHSAGNRARLRILPPLIAGQVPKPPVLKYVSLSQSAFGMELPEKTRIRWRSAYASVTIEQSHEDGVYSIKENGKEVYREEGNSMGPNQGIVLRNSVTGRAVDVVVRRAK